MHRLRCLRAHVPVRFIVRRKPCWRRVCPLQFFLLATGPLIDQILRRRTCARCVQCSRRRPRGCCATANRQHVIPSRAALGSGALLQPHNHNGTCLLHNKTVALLLLSPAAPAGSQIRLAVLCSPVVKVRQPLHMHRAHEGAIFQHGNAHRQLCCSAHPQCLAVARGDGTGDILRWVCMRP